MENTMAGGHTQEKTLRKYIGTEFEKSEKKYYDDPHYNGGIFSPLKKEKEKEVEKIGEACYQLAILYERTGNYHTACYYMYLAYIHRNKYAEYRRYSYLKYIINKRLYSVHFCLNKKQKEAAQSSINTEYVSHRGIYTRRIPEPWGSNELTRKF